MIRARVLATLAFALALGACAPRNVPPPGLDAAAVPGRYLAALAEREQVGRAIDAEVRVWLEGEALGDVPGFSGTLLLAGPDRCRLKVSSMFGVLFDVVARGDTVTALMPSRRLVLDLPRAEDTLGVREPGQLAFRVWSGTWRPPDEAWRRARNEDSLLHVRWVEAGDSLDLGIDARGDRRTHAGGHPPGGDGDGGAREGTHRAGHAGREPRAAREAGSQRARDRDRRARAARPVR